MNGKKNASIRFEGSRLRVGSTRRVTELGRSMHLIVNIVAVIAFIASVAVGFYT